MCSPAKRTARENLLEKATTLHRVLVSQDEDLLQIARQWQTAAKHFAGLAFAPQQGPSIGLLIEDLHLVAECMTADEIANQVIFLPLN